MGVEHKEMVACARRELGMRVRVYPGWVARGRMKQEAADREIAAMNAILCFLEVHAPEPVAPAPPPQGALFDAALLDVCECGLSRGAHEPGPYRVPEACARFTRERPR